MKRVAALALAAVAAGGCGTHALGKNDAAVFNAQLAQAELCASAGDCDAASEQALGDAISTTRRQPCTTIGGTPLRQRLEDAAGELAKWPAGERRIDRALRGMAKC